MTAPTLSGLVLSHWHLELGLDALACLCALLYVRASLRVDRWPLVRTACLFAAVATVIVALQSGLDAYDDQLLSVHMVQHMLLLMVAPPLLLLSRPALLLLRALPPPRRRATARALARLRPISGPLACLAVFYAVVLLTHLPPFYDATLSHPWLHESEHAAYLAAGTLMWWPIVGGDPSPIRRLGGLGSLVYVLAAMPPMALIGAYLNRHASLVYPPYGPPARALGVSALSDQATAGAIMWVVGNTIMVFGGLWGVLAALVRDERRQQARDARIAAGAGGQPGGGL